jgi:transcriptional regulator with XRE-family HTH domain
MGDFGYNLRKLRELRGLSPEQMADKIGQSERTYIKNESGEREMTRPEMKAAAMALEVPEELMMTLGERPIFNSFNNNQDGQYFNNYHGVMPEKQQALEQRVAHLEGKVETLEKLLLNEKKQLS